MAKRERYWVHSDPTSPAGVPDVAEPAGPPCPGECNRPWRQAEKRVAAEQARRLERRDPRPVEPHDVVPVPGAPVWCRSCQTGIRDALNQLPRLAADCAAMPGGKLAQTADLEGRFATRDGSPSGSPAWDAADEIVRWALGWEDRLRAHLHQVHEQPRPVRAALYTRVKDPDRDTARLVALGPVLRDPGARRKLAAAVAYLDAWLTPLLSSPMALEAGRQALGLARRAVNATGRDRVVHHLPLPCLRCDRNTLRRVDGSELIKCAACHACWDWSDYDRLAAAFAYGKPKTRAPHG